MKLIELFGDIHIGRDIVTEYTVKKVSVNDPYRAYRRNLTLPYEVPVLVNPPKVALISTVNKSPHKQLRYLVYEDDLYFWDAGLATHETMAESLGIEWRRVQQSGIFQIVNDEKGNIKFELSYASGILDIPYVKRLFEPLTDFGSTDLYLKDNVFKKNINEYAIKNVDVSLASQRAYRKATIPSYEVKVLINPPKDILVSFVANSSNRKLRYIAYQDELYFWDASTVIHETMADSIGMDWSQIRERGYFEPIEVKNRLQLRYGFFLQDIPYVKKLFEPVSSTNTHDLYLKETVKKNINEYAYIKVNTQEKEIKVFSNPSAALLVKLINASRERELRCYYDDGTFYFWDGYYLTHYAFCGNLDLPHSLKNCMYLKIKSNKSVLTYYTASQDIIETSSYIHTWFSLDQNFVGPLPKVMNIPLKTSFNGN